MSIAKLEHQVAMPTGGSDGSRRLRVVHGRQEVNLPAAQRAAAHLCMFHARGAGQGLTHDHVLSTVYCARTQPRGRSFMLARHD